MTRPRVLMVILILALCDGLPTDSAAKPASESDALKAVLEEIRTIKEGQVDIKKDLGELKKLLQTRQQASRPPGPLAIDAVIDIKEPIAKGNPTAPVVLMEFADFQCPACQNFMRTTMSQVSRDYFDPGKLRYVFMDYPLEAMHSLAAKAAEAAHCAGDQGKYWEMHDRLFTPPPALALPELANHAKALGLNAETFQHCLDSGQHRARIAASIAEAKRLGIQGTPGLILGIPTADGKIQARQMFRGGPPYPVLKEAIDGSLKPAPENPK